MEGNGGNGNQTIKHLSSSFVIFTLPLSCLSRVAQNFKSFHEATTTDMHDNIITASPTKYSMILIDSVCSLKWNALPHTTA
jgi:hypothetical protein